MKKKGSKCLTWTQRLQLESLLKAKLKKTEIAGILGVCLATVYNEIKRGKCTLLNGEAWEYYESYSAKG